MYFTVHFQCFVVSDQFPAKNRRTEFELKFPLNKGKDSHVTRTNLAIKMTSTKPIIAFSWLLRSYKRRRFKFEWLAFVFACLLASCSARNNPPRFLIDGQTEIVIRLKEGPDTPVGKNVRNSIVQWNL